MSEMSFLEHLGELRRRLIISISVIAAGAAIAFLYTNLIFKFLSEPYFKAFPAESLIGTGPAEAFILRLIIAILTGIVITTPILFSQVWFFIAPGLLPKEKKLALPFITVSSILFLLGIFFCHYFVLPLCYDFFFTQYLNIGVTPTIRITEHLAMISKVLLAFGLIFELPILAYVLGRAGLLTHTQLIAWQRHAIVIIFILAAILTPPDVFTQILMAVPLMILYWISIWVVKVSNRN